MCYWPSAGCVMATFHQSHETTIDVTDLKIDDMPCERTLLRQTLVFVVTTCVACSIFVSVRVVTGCSLIQHQCLQEKALLRSFRTFKKVLRSIAGATTLILCQGQSNGCRQIRVFRMGQEKTNALVELKRPSDCADEVKRSRSSLRIGQHGRWPTPADRGKEWIWAWFKFRECGKRKDNKRNALFWR